MYSTKYIYEKNNSIKERLWARHQLVDLNKMCKNLVVYYHSILGKIVTSYMYA
jgi:hypothetical protein